MKAKQTKINGVENFQKLILCIAKHKLKKDLP